MTIHDAHCHFFSRSFFAALASETGDAAASDEAVATIITRLGWDDPGSDVDLADRWVRELDVHQVARAMLIASVPMALAAESVGLAVKRHPARFVGGFMVNPVGGDAPAFTARGLDALGLHCVCLFPAMHHYSLDDSRVIEVLDVADRRPNQRAVVFVHCGVLALGVRRKLGLESQFDMRRGNPLDVLTLAQRYPQLSFVVPHFGAGFFREALMAADLAPNVYLDTSSSNGWVRYHPHLAVADVFQSALAVVGPNQLVFGTDSSFFPRGWQRPVWETQRDTLQVSTGDEGVDRVMAGTFDALFPPLRPGDV